MDPVDAVTALVLRTKPRACCLHAHEFFLAFQGVLVLVFSGWPPSLAALKSELNNSELGLKTEGAGSKWPKVTLAATVDDAPPLTLSQLEQIRELCQRHGLLLRSKGVAVDALSLVKYTWRGLEAAGLPISRTLELEKPLDSTPPSTGEEERVAITLDEWSGNRLSTYLEGANREGSRASSYREASPSGSTIVTFLGPAVTSGKPLSEALDAFARDVNDSFPGRFVWLDRNSLHCTLRGIVW